MVKKFIAGSCFVLFATAASAQTLFTYGNDSVTVKEFLQAYNKNNTGAKNAKAVQEYLDLYIASRLKIKEAKARGYDTLPQIQVDLENLRTQIIPAYLKDEDAVIRLTDEAFSRSQKDIHLAHIFISFTQNGLKDDAVAYKKATDAYAQLQKGKDFSFVAKDFSDDPSVKDNGGDIGYITVFSLPYELENLAYNTPAGKVSTIYKSKAGYHIFKNGGERKALGRMKAAQILFAFPPGVDAAYKRDLKKLADSVYARLQKGDDFSKLATQYSNDVVSASAGGSLPEFGIGQYQKAFENVAFGLTKDGAISQPFETPFGYHIVKRISKVPVNASKTNVAAMAALREKVESSDRMKSTTDALAQKILKNAGFAKQPFAEKELQAYTDSVLDFKRPGMKISLNNETALFTLGQDKIATTDWINFAQTARYKADGSGIKTYSQLWDEFVQASAMNYYQQHLEQYNETFRNQLNEFKEGNLFFEIMQRQVWNAAQTDTAALQDYYNKNKAKYKWAQSADAVIFYAGNAAEAKTFYDQLKKSPAKWKALVDATHDKVAADSSRFELKQLPNRDKKVLTAGTITLPVINTADNTASFAYIIKTYAAGQQRNFAEAKGLVINDYQAELEKKWMEELKKKYPVAINQKALQNLK